MQQTETLIKFGQRIAELRTQKGISQEQLSYAAKLSRSHVGMIERAEKNITLSTIERLARGLGVSIKELFDYE